MSKTSPSKGARVVRYTRADGTTKEYRYGPHQKREAARYGTDTIGALILAYQRSPRWAALKAASRELYGRYLRPLEEALAHVPAREVRRRMLLDMRDALASSSGNGAANAFLRSASALFAWGVEREWIEHNPLARVRGLAGGHLPTWTGADFDRALAGLPEHLRRVVLLAAFTGQRRGDLCALRWSAYDGEVLRLVQQKTGTPLVIPAHPRLRAELDAWKRTASSTHILTTAHGRPWNTKTLTAQLPRALAQIGGFPPGLNVHGLRKLAAVWIAERGGTTHEIAAVTGHKTLGMIALYTAAAQQEQLASAAIHKLGSDADKTTKAEVNPLKNKVAS